MDSSKPLAAARRLLDDVLTHPLNDDQAIRVAEVLVALAVAEKDQPLSKADIAQAEKKPPVLLVSVPEPDDSDILGPSSKGRAAKPAPLKTTQDTEEREGDEGWERANNAREGLYE